MAYDQNMELSLQLLLGDLEDLEDKRKGKQRADKPTDLELALMCMKEEILTAQASNQDRILALSTSTAIATDQSILRFLRNDERIAEQDHRYAVALNNGRSAQNASNIPSMSNPTLTDENEDAVAVAMGDLMGRTMLDDRSDHGGPSRRVSSRPTDQGTECASCFAKGDDIMFVGSCGHAFCRPCTRQMFLGAIKDEELYPPRCCGDVVPPGTALRVLSYKELRAFSERAIEWTAKDRLYCAEPTCSKFIPPFAIQDEHGTCPECHQQTHLPCRSLAHPRVDCPMDDALHVVLEMADAEGWKRCSNCRTMVELQHGCNHITCRCGYQFCYICGLAWRTCTCPVWQEERLVAMANQAVDERMPLNENIADRQNAFNRIVEDLRQNEDVGCEHHRRSQWAWRGRGSLECEFCNQVLPEYIFVCTNCLVRACNSCRRHRMR